tara:strand:- start:660 stop:782 length:123 start_codon:yes stop_codon:yes gene_type:complete
MFNFLQIFSASQLKAIILIYQKKYLILLLTVFLNINEKNK